MSYQYPHSQFNLLGTGSLIPKIKSIQDVDLNNEGEIVNWFQEAAVSLSEFYSSWYSMCRENISFYTGQTPFDQYLSWAGDIPIAVAKDKSSKTNYVAAIVETHVARLTSSRAAITVTPVHSNEYRDKSAAKTSEQVIKTIFRDRKLDEKAEKVVRHTLVCGSGYLLIEWDPKAGPLGEDGTPLGDVNYKILNFNEIMCEPAPLEEMDWFIEIDRVSTERLNEQYPGIGLEPDTWNPFIQGDDSTLVGFNHDEATTVLTLRHKAVPNLPQGLKIRVTRNNLLEIGEMDCEILAQKGKLPLCRLDDVVPPGMILPIPLTILEAAKGPQAQVNQLNKIINRNITVSAPKWVVRRGSVSLEHLNNAAGILQYRGEREPRLLTASSVPSEIFKYRETLLNDIHQTTGAFKQSFGSSAPNTRAGVMLEFHEEQEFKRAEPLIKRYNNFIADVADITLAYAACYYSDEDERTVKVMGDRTGGAFRRFQAADLTGTYDIKIERSSALPDSKEGKLRWITQLATLFPGKFDWEQVKKALDFGSDKDLVTSETAAYELQCLENDLIYQGINIKAPETYQDHLSHLKALYPLIDSIEFAELPVDVKKKFLDHARAHEMMAWQRGMTNPMYAQQITVNLPQYPKVFVTLPSIQPFTVEAPVPPPAMGNMAEQPQVTNMRESQNDVRDPTDV